MGKKTGKKSEMRWKCSGVGFGIDGEVGEVEGREGWFPERRKERERERLNHPRSLNLE